MIKLRCISAPKSWSHIKNIVVLTILTFRHIQCLNLMYADSLGTNIFGNSSSAASNTRSRLPSRLSFRFLWLWSNDHKVKPLHVMLPKTSAYVKRYDGQTKWMYFLIQNDDLLEKCNTICDKVSADIKK